MKTKRKWKQKKAMTDKEKILKAINQKQQEIWPTDTGEMTPATVPNNLEQGWLNALKWMVSLINSLPDEQQPSEDFGIDEELKRFFEINNLFVDANDLQTVRHCNGSPVDKRYYFEDIAHHFAQWQKEQIINKACEWLKENIYNRVYKCNDNLGFPTTAFLEEFKKTMEDK